jgi:hypothetical protein
MEVCTGDKRMEGPPRVLAGELPFEDRVDERACASVQGRTNAANRGDVS